MSAPRLGAPLTEWIAEGNPARVRKAADIPDGIFLDAVRAVKRLRPRAMTSRWDVGFILGGQAEYVATIGRLDVEPRGHLVEVPWPDPVIPEKIVLAKAKRLIRRGLLEGCACGCRGDFEAHPSPGFDVEDDMSRGVKFSLKAPTPPASVADYERIRSLFSRGAS
ncbi:hypothetical protein [Frankia sp. AgW1.1]|uniref:hypothetical protein n=1 Tax=Frankia sp. AgW1.1 TaxID=1836971 RepID=UPI001933550F|nr:hypothetical protein [Frankia sp. AgW1.1]MBL7487125.1 hypothetical protein [Frankia sp. AgW1.1]